MTEMQRLSNENEAYEIDLLELLTVWRRHLIPIVIVTVICAILGFFSSFVVPKKYRAVSSIFVVSASSGSLLDLSDLNFGTSLARDYAELVTSRTMLERVAEASGTNYSATAMRSMVDVSNTSNTRILKFTVTTSKKEEAKLLADTFARQSVIYLPEIMGLTDNQPVIVDLAVEPNGPYNISFPKFTAIGLLIGLVLVLGFYTIRYILNDTINSPRDLEKYFGLVPLATIPENGQKHRSAEYYKRSERRS